jgi:alanine racemase
MAVYRVADATHGEADPAHDTEALTAQPSPSWGRGRPAVAEIDLSAIAHNVRAVKALVGAHCKVMAVVKANGYGLGAPWVAMAALEGGASALAVACVDEAVELRRAGYAGPVLVMGYVPPEEAEAVVRHNLSVVLHRARTAAALELAAAGLRLPEGSVPVHLKVDTGMGRYGCAPDELLPLALAVSRFPHLRIEGLMTHFADADSPDLSFARRQLELFNRLRRQVEQSGVRFDVVHAANSAATLAFPESHLDMVRIGIMLSGHLPSPRLAGRIALRRALTVRARLARIFRVEPGHGVGYGRIWVARRPSLIGLVPVGYADGYRRALSNTGYVLVGGRRCPVVGRVSMDQMTVDLTDLPEVTEGDEVVLIGRQGGDEITVDQVADWAGTISYEILCGLPERLPRRYIYEGEAVEVCNLLGCTPLTARPVPRKELSR